MLHSHAGTSLFCANIPVLTDFPALRTGPVDRTSPKSVDEAIRAVSRHAVRIIQAISAALIAGPVGGEQKVRRLRSLTAQPARAGDMPLLLPAVVSFRLNLAVMAAPQFPINVRSGALAAHRCPVGDHLCQLQCTVVPLDVALEKL